jgi:hypothetical protein
MCWCWTPDKRCKPKAFNRTGKGRNGGVGDTRSAARDLFLLCHTHTRSRADLRLVLSGTFAPPFKAAEIKKPIGEFEAGYWMVCADTLVAATRMRLAVGGCNSLAHSALVLPLYFALFFVGWQELRQSDLRAFFAICPEALNAMLQNFSACKPPFNVLALGPRFSEELKQFVDDTAEDQLKVDYQVRPAVLSMV